MLAINCLLRVLSTGFLIAGSNLLISFKVLTNFPLFAIKSETILLGSNPSTPPFLIKK